MKSSYGKSVCVLLLYSAIAVTVSTAQSLKTLVNLDGTVHGSNPHSSLIIATDGNFYGTTYSGGSSLNCSGGCGTVFKMTPGGTITTLHGFSNGDGARPYSGVIQANDGNFYGTTTLGGTLGGGTVYKIASTARSRRSTASVEAAARSLTADWCKAPTETSMGPRTRAA